MLRDCGTPISYFSSTPYCNNRTHWFAIDICSRVSRDSTFDMSGYRSPLGPLLSFSIVFVIESTVDSRYLDLAYLE